MSYWTTTIYGIDIYLGFDLVKDLEVRTVKQVLEERQLNGKYKSLENFIIRTGVSEIQIAILIRIGAFGFTDTVKTNMQWESLYICSEIKDRSLPIGLFDEAVKVPELPKFEYSLAEHLYDEIRYFKFPITATWFSLIRSTFRGVYANNMDKHVGKTVRMVGDFVTYKPVRTKKGEMMMFGTFLDDEGNFFNTVHFPNSLKGYRFQGMGVYLVEGLITMEFGYCSITVSQCAKIPLIPDPWEPGVTNRKLLI